MTRRPWTRWSDERLLDVRLADLGLRIEGSPLAPRVARLYDELEARGIAFRPHVWLSTDWFSPDSVPGIAAPFYLAHPRLIRLERRESLRAEGATERECLRLLRHEAGHALDTAFGLARRAAWRDAFGLRNTPYQATYTANPFSRDYVRHLPRWYAQSHPAEDFAETFAVWLAPRSRWRSTYADDRRARAKLETVDALMRTIADEPPRRALRERPYSLATQRRTLRELYALRRRALRRESRPPFERFLLEHAEPSGRPGRSPVAAHLHERAPRITRRLTRDGRLLPYDVEQVVEGMAHRARRTGLRWRGARRPTLKALEESVRRTLEALRKKRVRLGR